VRRRREHIRPLTAIMSCSLVEMVTRHDGLPWRTFNQLPVRFGGISDEILFYALLI
jgi:hypothetical protein